jgi:hypothetical protein
MLKSSWAISRVNDELKTNVSKISAFVFLVDVTNDFASLIRAYMGCISDARSTVMTQISEMMVFNSTLIRLLARDFTTFIHPVFSMYIHLLLKILLKVALQAFL